MNTPKITLAGKPVEPKEYFTEFVMFLGGYEPSNVGEDGKHSIERTASLGNFRVRYCTYTDKYLFETLDENSLLYETVEEDELMRELRKILKSLKISYSFKEVK